MTKQAKTALATILDKVNQIGTLTGGEVLTDTDYIDISSQAEIKKEEHMCYSYNEIDSEKVLFVDPNFVKNWKYHDRTSEDFGDLDGFAQELKDVGQIHPCIVRPCDDDVRYKYEVIIGERRWRAASLAGIKLKIIVKNFNNHDAALLQAMENSSRKDISDYAKGMSYASMVTEGILTQKDLQENLKLSQSSIRNLLSFSKIKPEIVKAIKNITQLSAATAYTITRLQDKGNEYTIALIELADKINSGKIGHSKILDLIDQKTTNSNDRNENKNCITTENGHHLFTWQKDKDGQKAIIFPQKIRQLINYQRIQEVLIQEIQNQLCELLEINH